MLHTSKVPIRNPYLHMLKPSRLVILSLSFCLLLPIQASVRDSLQLYYLNGQYKAIVLALADQPDLSEPELLCVTESMKHLGRLPQALSLVNAFSQEKTLSTDGAYYLAALCAEGGRLNEAILLYSQLLLTDSLEHRAELPLARLHLKTGVPIRAVPLLKTVVKHDSLNITGLRLLAKAYNELDEQRLENAVLRRVLRLDPENMEVKLELARVNLKIGNFDFVHRLCHAEMERDPNAVQFYRYNGFAFYKEGEYAGAYENLKKALNMHDRSELVIKYMGISAFKTEHYEECIKHLKSCVVRYGHSEDVDFFLGSALSYTGDAIGALPYLQKALDLMSPQKEVIAELQLQLGVSNRSLKLYHLAHDNFVSAFSTDSVYAVLAFFYLGSMSEFDLGEEREALGYYQRFLNNVEKGKRQKDFDDGTNITFTRAAERRISAIKEHLFFNEGVK